MNRLHSFGLAALVLLSSNAYANLNCEYKDSFGKVTGSSDTPAFTFASNGVDIQLAGLGNQTSTSVPATKSITLECKGSLDIPTDTTKKRLGSIRIVPTLSLVGGTQSVIQVEVKGNTVSGAKVDEFRKVFEFKRGDNKEEFVLDQKQDEGKSVCDDDFTLQLKYLRISTRINPGAKDNEALDKAEISLPKIEFQFVDAPNPTDASKCKL